MDTSHLQYNTMVSAGAVTVLLSTVLGYLLSKKGSGDKEEAVIIEEEIIEELDTSKYPGGYITIFYGSQTGTAESFSNEIEREGESNGFKVDTVDLENIENDVVSGILKDHKKDDNGKHRVVFMMATYGEGEPTDNAVQFLKFLKEGGVTSEEDMDQANDDDEEKKGEDDVPSQSNVFKDVEYSVFGLGNKQYEHYNATGKLVDSFVEKLGGFRIIKIGLGDDDNDLESDFDNWKDNKLWPALKKRYNSNSEVKNTSNEIPECQYAVEYLENPSEPDLTGVENANTSSKQYFTATECEVTLKRELRGPNDSGSTLHVEIDATELKYQTADNLAILPVNDDVTVEKIAKALNYDLTAYFKLVPAKGYESKFDNLFPMPCTVYQCLVRYCDLIGCPSRSELKRFARYAKDPTCQKALLRMASKQGKEEYKEKIVNAKMGIADIITRLCPSISMPLEHFLSICPRLKPRYYTISSSASVHPKSIHATVSVLSEERKDGSTFKGVCSNYLSGINNNGKIQAFVRDSTFRLPSDSSRPIIMIGPGTGIAPMRALLQERDHQRRVQKLNVGQNILYFGCKNRVDDFIYSDELNQYEKDGILTEMYLAFSREQDEKVYVQNLLQKNSKKTWELINDEDAYVYVCGGVKMGQDVTETIRKIVAQYGDRSSVDAKKYVEEMAASGRFVQELWA
jgi:NADPH-ferrihemoprotein reductase